MHTGVGAPGATGNCAPSNPQAVPDCKLDGCKFPHADGVTHLKSWAPALFTPADNVLQAKPGTAGSFEIKNPSQIFLLVEKGAGVICSQVVGAASS
jgi:hypothetical protein